MIEITGPGAQVHQISSQAKKIYSRMVENSVYYKLNLCLLIRFLREGYFF